MADNTLRVDANAGTQKHVVRRGRLADQSVRIIFLVCAALIVIITLGVFIFLGFNAFRVFGEDAAVKNFLTSTNWDPQGVNNPAGTHSYGMLGFILGSLVTTLIAVIIVIPLAFGMAIFMTEVAPHWLVGLLRPLIEIFNGLPSVVVGFLGLVYLTPIIKSTFGPYAPVPATAGYGWGAAIVVLIIMVLPTVISISIDSLRAVPDSVREASLALGSSRWQMMKSAVLPAATTGLATAVVLGMGRAIGETLAVALVLKGNTELPNKLFTPFVFFQPNINMTLPIVLNFPDASGAERDAYLLLAFVLLAISFLFICISRYLASRSVYK